VVYVNEYSDGKSATESGWFKQSSDGGNKGIYRNNNDADEPNDPKGSTTWATGSGSRTSVRPITAVTFATDPNPPLPAVVVSPVDEAGFVGFTPTLTWKADLAGAAPTGYTVYFGTDEDDLVELTSGTAVTFTITTPLDHSATYYWQVVPRNATGETDVEDCPVWSFTTRGLYVGNTGTTNAVDMPMGPGYNYSTSQVIYTQAELVQAGILGRGEITHLYYQANGSGVNLDANNNEWKIYMGTTQNDSFPGANNTIPTTTTGLIPTTQMDLVKEGVVATANLASGEWVRIELDEAFEYPGVGNIVVHVNEYSPNHTGSTSSPHNGWYATSTSVNRAFQALNEATAFDPEDIATWIAGDRKNYYNTRPNLAVTFVPEAIAPEAVVIVSPADEAVAVPHTPTLSWRPVTTGGIPSEYTIYLDTDPDPTTEVYSGFTTAVPAIWTVTPPLAPSTTYYWKVVASNAEGVAPDSEVWSFETLGSIVGATGTSQMHIPTGPYQNYSNSQVIYTEAELAAAGITSIGAITHLYYQASGQGINLSDGNSNEWLIYMGGTQKSVFSSNSDWVPLAEMTQVKDGVISTANLAANEWVKIELEPAFVYSGSGNIVIYVNEYSPGLTGVYANTWVGAGNLGTGNYRAIQRLGANEAYIPKGNAEWSEFVAGTGNDRYTIHPNLAVTFDPTVYTVSGTVFTDAQTPVAVGDATITFTNTSTNQAYQTTSKTTAGEVGDYEITLVSGAYEISVFAQVGGVPYEYVSGSAVTINADRTGLDFEISLASMRTVSGMVVYYDEADVNHTTPLPVAGATITFTNTNEDAPSPNPVTSSNVAGSEGEYTVTLFGGIYHVTATGTVGIQHYTFISPENEPLEVRDANQHYVITMSVVTYTVRGELVLAAGAPTGAYVNGLKVELINLNDSGNSPASVLSTTGGVFTFPAVQNGSYELKITNLITGLFYSQVDPVVVNNDDVDIDPITLDNALSGEEAVIIPVVTALKGNYPNPFNPSTTIAFDMAREGHVNIEIYNIKGQRVKTLVSGEYAAGSYRVVWNGDDAVGRAVGSGVYFYRMTTTGYVKTQKMLLMK